MIVDDERYARRHLRALIDQLEGVSVVAEAACLSQARSELLRIQPDILLLDIQLGGETAFDLLPHIPSGVWVVFVTAYADFAIKAYDNSIADYLLKPIRLERLRRTVVKCRGQLNDDKATPARSELLWVGDSANWQQLPVEAVTGILAEGSYTRVFTREGTSLLMLRSLKEWQKLLPKQNFVRLDRSLLINFDAVQKVQITSRDQAAIEVAGSAKPFTLGRVAIRRLRKYLRQQEQAD